MNALMVIAKVKEKLPISKGSSGSWEKQIEASDGIITKYIDKSVDRLGDKITSKLADYGTFLLSDLISILEVGALMYGFYHCVLIMWLGNKNSNNKALPMDKIAFSYFVFFILRITNTVIKVWSGIISGK